VGRLHTDKGFDILIDSFRDLAAVFPDWDLVILGEGPERDRLQGQIDVAGLAGRISMPGRVGNMQQWYQACDIYVLSSRVEGLSNSLLEAMACGMPSVAFDCETGPREIIRPDIDGLLVTPVEDPQALAAALSGLMQDKQARKTLASRAVDVRDRFSMRRVLSLWQEVFNDIQHQDKKG
jgi:glycosyltransferase involved in cell wall biosynthesis